MFVPASCLQKAHGKVDSSQLQLCRTRAAASRAGIKQCSSSWEGAAEKTTAGRALAGAAESALLCHAFLSHALQFWGCCSVCVWVCIICRQVRRLLPVCWPVCTFCDTSVVATERCMPRVVWRLPSCVFERCLPVCGCRQHEPAWVACGHGEA